ncbi:glycine-rich cell wall structural protein 1 isoform X2 [Daphnia magna]|uniref:glycine-rich cell wall structural protein 1 isoform X2 n=1 Tax=Daphnia magna TaxID=35525 RepID=UPI001E1BDD6E|nr:glycine-rich cell wall structural protein 1 isoform X2 [Daphnia magna]
MNVKMIMLLIVASVMVSCSFAAPQLGGRLIGLRRPFGGGFGGRPGFNQGFGNQGFGNQGFQPGFGGGNAAGLGSGSVIGNQAIGTGTGIANPGPGGFGIGLGVGAAVATPIGNFAVGDGQSISVGK